ncbi:MAG: hypothetical protein ACWGOD_00770 [Desulfobulbales bacterium]
MSVYGWQEEENGKAMLLFLEELNKQVSSLPAWGSLAVGIGKSVGDYIRPKCNRTANTSGRSYNLLSRNHEKVNIL